MLIVELFSNMWIVKLLAINSSSHNVDMMLENHALNFICFSNGKVDQSPNVVLSHVG